VNRKFLGEVGAQAFRKWIREAVAGNMPYDKFVHAVLTAKGSNVVSPAASYYKVLRTPDAVMENTTQLFLAVRFNCNKCHDHPFERWTQDQYYQLAAYFARVGRSEDPKFRGAEGRRAAPSRGAVPLVEVINDTGDGEVKHVRTNADTRAGVPLRPQGPRGHQGFAGGEQSPGGSRRRRTLTSPAATSTACGPTRSASG